MFYLGYSLFTQQTQESERKPNLVKTFMTILKFYSAYKLKIKI